METLYKNDSGFMQMTLICYVCHQIIEFMQNRNKNNNEKNTITQGIQRFM